MASTDRFRSNWQTTLKLLNRPHHQLGQIPFAAVTNLIENGDRVELEEMKIAIDNMPIELFSTFVGGFNVPARIVIDLGTNCIVEKEPLYPPFSKSFPGFIATSLARSNSVKYLS